MPKGYLKYKFKFLLVWIYKSLKAQTAKHVWMLEASSNVFASANYMVKFNGFNYDECFEQIWSILGVMALDSAILTDMEPQLLQ